MRERVYASKTESLAGKEYTPSVCLNWTIIKHGKI